MARQLGRVSLNIPERASEQCCSPFPMPVCLLRNASVQEELSLSLCKEMAGGWVKIPSIFWVGASAVGNPPGKMLQRKTAAGHFPALGGAESKEKGEHPLDQGLYHGSA